MGLKTEFVHEVEIIYETTGDYMNFKFRADEETDPIKIFEEFTRNCSIIVHSVEEDEVEVDDEDDSDIYTIKVNSDSRQEVSA